MTEYDRIGFKCGVEVHNRLATQHKLFCNCPPALSSQKPEKIIERKIRAVAGELGKIDIAAEYEYLRNREFHYQIFPDTCCLVEEDDEPPHPLNEGALQVALQAAKLLQCFIPDEIHVMRKTVIDGSNTSGFQRTAIVGLNGSLKTSLGIVKITNISVEEESAGIVSQEGNKIVYRLDRLGIPLIEIGTAADIKSPAHAREVAEKLGMIIRSTGKSQRGLGVTRQDVNVSIKGGARVEIKGVQDLEQIEKIIKNEVKRQLELIRGGQKPKEETRTAKPDGITEYMRPLPGGERMYPETDIPPIEITKQMLARIKLPETWEQKLKKFGKVLPKQIAEQILRSEFLELFEKFQKYDAVLVANVFTSVLKDLRRKGFDISKISDNNFEKIFSAVKSKKISKEAVPHILELICQGEAIKNALKRFSSVRDEELRKEIKRMFSAYPQLVKKKNVSALMGEAMKFARGKIDGATVAKILKEELENAR